MATMISGSQGSVTIPVNEKGQTIVVTSWQGTLDQDVFDATPFTVTDNARTKGLGMSTLSGTLTGFPQDNLAPELGSIATNNATPIAGMVLQTSSTDTFTFDAVVDNMTVTMEKTGQASVTLAFESSGAVVVA